MDMPETAEEREANERADQEAVYQAAQKASGYRPTPAPLNRHQRRRYAALSRTARTR